MCHEHANGDLQDGDPRVEPSIFDGRRSPIGGESLELKNRGRESAYSDRIAPLKLRKRTVHFPCLADSIPPAGFDHLYADLGVISGTVMESIVILER